LHADCRFAARYFARLPLLGGDSTFPSAPFCRFPLPDSWKPPSATAVFAGFLSCSSLLPADFLLTVVPPLQLPWLLRGPVGSIFVFFWFLPFCAWTCYNGPFPLTPSRPLFFYFLIPVFYRNLTARGPCSFRFSLTPSCGPFPVTSLGLWPTNLIPAHPDRPPFRGFDPSEAILVVLFSGRKGTFPGPFFPPLSPFHRLVSAPISLRASFYGSFQFFPAFAQGPTFRGPRPVSLKSVGNRFLLSAFFALLWSPLPFA